MGARLTTAVVGACLAALIIAAPSAHAAFPGRNGEIAYASVDDGCLDAINPDGSGRRTVACNPTPDDTPAWSPDGKVIASVLGSVTIATVNADGTQNRPIYDAGTVVGTGWSPDALKIVFSAFDACSVCSFIADIWTLNPDGTGATNITNTPNFDELDPDWSPDGTKVAFRGRQCTPSPSGGATCAPSDIYIMNPDGTGVVDLTNTPDSSETEPSWAPDGHRIAFVRGSNIWTMNADGSDQVNLTNSAAGNSQPAWSPDGTKIAFTSNRGAGANEPFDIYVMNADGGNVTRVTTSPQTSHGNVQPDWQPIPVHYARPKGATPFQTFLVPAYKPCAAPNTSHGPPLAFGSCNPPQQASAYLTVGTPDANGQGAKSRAIVLMRAFSCPACVGPGPNADVRLDVSITDVRNKGDLSDYTGELQADAALRITDRNNTPNPGGPGAGTVSDTHFPFTVPCAATADTTVGSTCSVSTSANAVVPNSVFAGQRAIWQLGQVQVYDGGADGLASTTADNTLFMDQGVFVP